MAFIPSPYRPLPPLPSGAFQSDGVSSLVLTSRATRKRMAAHLRWRSSSPSTSDVIDEGVSCASPMDIIFYLDREHSDEGLGVFQLLQHEMKTEKLELWVYSKRSGFTSVATSTVRLTAGILTGRNMCMHE